MHLHMKAAGMDVIAIVPTLGTAVEEMTQGTHLKLTFPPEAIHLFDAETEEAV